MAFSKSATKMFSEKDKFLMPPSNIKIKGKIKGKIFTSSSDLCTKALSNFQWDLRA